MNRVLIFSFYKPYSDETAEKIDERVKKYLEDAYDVAKSTILKHKKTIEKIAELLIKKEYISGEDFSMMVENPDKIDEFRDTDEIVTKAEENGDESESKTIDEVKKEDGNKGKMKKAEPKKDVKKNTTSKKA